MDGLSFAPGLEEAIAKALAKKPDGRYQSAIEFAAALRPFAGEGAAALDNIFQMTPAPPSASIFRSGSTPGDPSPAAASGAEKSRPGTGLIVGVAALCLVLGAVVTIVLLRFLGQ